MLDRLSPLELETKVHTKLVITEKTPTRAFSWLKVPTCAFTFRTLLRHYAKRMWTLRSFEALLPTACCSLCPAQLWPVSELPHSHGHSAVHCLSNIEATTSDNTSAVRSGRTKYLKIFAKILSIKLQPAAGLGVFGCRKVRTYY